MAHNIGDEFDLCYRLEEIIRQARELNPPMKIVSGTDSATGARSFYFTSDDNNSGIVSVAYPHNQQTEKGFKP